MRECRFVVLTLLGLLAAAPVFAQSNRTDIRLPEQRSMARFGLERAWWGQAVLNPKRDRVEHVTCDEENVYVQASSGMVTALNGETGRRVWAVQLGLFDAPSLPASTSEDLVLIAVGIRLFALRKSDGHLEFDLRLPSTPSTSATIGDNVIYMGMLNGSTYAFDVGEIRRLYLENRLDLWSNNTVLWRHQAAKEVTTPPVIVGRAIVFASRDGSLYAVSAETGDLIYQFETDAAITAPMSYANGHLYLVSEDFTFYCLNAENGTVIWNFLSGLPIKSQPQVIGSQLYLLPHLGGMYSLDSLNGQRIWWRPGVREFLAATQQMVYASDGEGNVLLLSQEDGAVLGVLRLQDFPHRAYNDRTDRLYVAARNGLVIAVREAGHTFPIYQKYPERRPILPEFAPEEGDVADPDEAATPIE